MYIAIILTNMFKFSLYIFLIKSLTPVINLFKFFVILNNTYYSL